LLPLVISEEWIARTRAAMPELPVAMRERFVSDYAISAYDAGVLTSTKTMASYFEATVNAVGGEAKICANWIMGELSAALNRAELSLEQSPVSAAHLAMLVKRITDGTLSGKLAKEVFEALWQAEGEVDAIIEARGLKQVSDSGAIEAVVAQVLADNPNQVAEYRAGKEKMLSYLIGQAMKAMKGKANPQQLNEILLRMLA
jgi:aspartyl-tRNA(Asn)/glutamyl-tRNA(Gln) amidotransferase subunit B